MDKDYWRLKKREQRAKKKGVSSEGLPESSLVEVGQACPEGVLQKEWEYAIKRAIRARKYADMFPNHVRPSELKYQDPMWQWENEVRGRFTNIVGGKLGAVSDSQLRDR